jgi:hypothetical protein
MVSDVPKVRRVMLLKNKGDFLMHGVVLQSRDIGAAPRETALDVSRNTFLRKSWNQIFPLHCHSGESRNP